MLSNYIEVIETVNEPLLEMKFVKQYLRINHDYEDEILTQIIRSAIEAAESFLQIYINMRKIKVNTNFSNGKLILKFHPINKIEIINLTETNHELQSEIDYRFNQSSLEFKDNHENKLVQVKYYVGFSKATLPASIKQGLLTHINELYEREQPEGGMSAGVLLHYNPLRKRKI